MRSRTLLVLAVLFTLVCCNLFGGPSKVRSGQLFEAGSPEYDAYFKDVHLLQVAAAGWDDDKKATRRPLVDALKLGDDAADVSLSQATHERMVAVAHEVGATRLEIKNDEPRVVAQADSRVDAPTRELFHAIEAVAKAELDRAKNMRQIPPKIDGLTKTGRALLPRVPTDFARRGGDVATDVKQELDASLDVIGTVSTSSRNEAREAEDFVSDLQRAVQADPSEPLPKGDAGGAPAAKPTSRPVTRPPPPPVSTGETKPVPKPVTKPQTGGGGEEEFSP